MSKGPISFSMFVCGRLRFTDRYVGTFGVFGLQGSRYATALTAIRQDCSSFDIETSECIGLRVADLSEA